MSVCLDSIDGDELRVVMSSLIPMLLIRPDGSADRSHQIIIQAETPQPILKFSGKEYLPSLVLVNWEHANMYKKQFSEHPGLRFLGFTEKGARM